MFSYNRDSKKFTYEIKGEDNLSAKLNITNANQHLIMLESIDVPPSMRGKNISAQLIGMAAEDAIKRDAKFIPMDPYIREKLIANPEWSEMIRL